MNDQPNPTGLATAEPSTSSDIVERARALAPLLASAAPQIEQRRELTPEVVTALHESGMFRMLIPRSLGGLELPPRVYIEAIEELARGDASSAWCVAQIDGACTIAASLDPAAAREIFAADGRALLAVGPPHASGKAVAVEGGYRVTGNWQYASGSRHAHWMAAHCPVFEADGKQRLDAKGMPVDRTLIFQKSSATMSDVWHVMGLKGTGSDSYSVTDLFVPEQRTMTAFGRNPAEKRERGPLYQFTTFQLHGASFAAIALGIARTTLDAFVDLAKNKTPYGLKYVLRDNAVIQSQIGIAQSQLAAARVFLHYALDEMTRGAEGQGITLPQRVQLRMASCNASHTARQVVDTAYHAAGATAVFENNPFERRFRDVNTVSQQVQSHFAVFEAIGQYYLGLPLHPRLI
jgi:alkylation response protein AidB-like acyl-CoA dehydrogenase